MEEKYLAYVTTHIEMVNAAYEWMKKNLPVSKDYDFSSHDKSKFSQEEFEPYAQHFCGDGKNDINPAWLHHIHENPHHWEHWVLVREDGSAQALEMPEEYIVEMVCDWMTFGIINNEPAEIFCYWSAFQSAMNLHPKTKARVEELLNDISNNMDSWKERVLFLYRYIER